MIQDHSQSIRDRLNYLDSILSKLENSNPITVYGMIKGEIESLKSQIQAYNTTLKSKEVVGKEEKPSKTRYYLKDGSVYVIKGKEYKYLYDANTKIVTYEFANGQIERTFENGIKEIRRKDGTIVIKSGLKEFEFIETPVNSYKEIN